MGYGTILRYKIFPASLERTIITCLSKIKNHK